MKYPVLKVAHIPRSFKHCEISPIVIFEYDADENFINGEELDEKQAYLVFVKEEIEQLVDSLMTLARPQIMRMKNQRFVALKDNADMYKLKDIVNKLLIEINYYTKDTLNVRARIFTGMIMLEGKEPTFFKTKKVGDPVFESSAYQNSLVYPEGEIDKGELSYITPYSEFKLINYKKLKK